MWFHNCSVFYNCLKQCFSSPCFTYCLSSAQVAAIWKHQSQKDRALFPGADPREFWQRARDRNRDTAEVYNKLGLTGGDGMQKWQLTWQLQPN